MAIIKNSVFTNSADITAVEKNIRAGLKDIWNSEMVNGARFGKYDIPFCPTTANTIPKSMITWEEAKAIHKRNISKKNYTYHENAFVNWYIDDYKFDGPKGIWHNKSNVLKILQHFDGAITPDFSTYQDFPEAIKIYATYRMRAFGYWLGMNNIPVINNVRWGTSESFRYCFEGIPVNSVVCIGTVGGGPRKLENRKRFENGINKMIECIKPNTILVYGSARGDCFNQIKHSGIKLFSYKSRTAKFFEVRSINE